MYAVDMSATVRYCTSYSTSACMWGMCSRNLNLCTSFFSVQYQIPYSWKFSPEEIFLLFLPPARMGEILISWYFCPVLAYRACGDLYYTRENLIFQGSWDGGIFCPAKFQLYSIWELAWGYDYHILSSPSPGQTLINFYGNNHKLACIYNIAKFILPGVITLFIALCSRTYYSMV